MDARLPGAALDLDLTGERPDTVTATNRGEPAAALVHLYRGGAAPALSTAVDGYVRQLTDGLPQYRGRIALVVDGLRAALVARRGARADEVRGRLAAAPWVPGELVEEERYLDLRLSTVDGGAVAGQVVTDGSRLVYASLFAAAG
ncbi:hypothetical protein [Dactylosporangium matsuzakiense]|uniref:Uncharacterized protein n=1 Tax=Dactylosporangium matsuzakiense TaxID=53360 RepID=A0A9W6KNR7_9ACTN|nr:hypothetical protein [Dactylosporangium matsuzakiense]UWZ42761.1 hypothetical protein Dmats_35285 [Dactylosporangium matsuzakiense]GLL05416.1 hypothetical protein GCM10017581_071630 [Dactylosporangium matsuzakiense]